MQHFAALVFVVALSFCSVHSFLLRNDEENEKCKEVSRNTRTNVFFILMQFRQSDITGGCTPWNCFLRIQDVRDIWELSERFTVAGKKEFFSVPRTSIDM